MDNTNSPTMSMGEKPGNLDPGVNSHECLCYRPRRTVICNNCGFKAFGRKHFICLRHPKTTYLLDWPQCPNCRGYCLNEY